MKEFRFAARLIVMLTICIHSVAGQTNVPVAQNNARVATNSGTQARNVRPARPTSQIVGRGAVGIPHRASLGRPIQAVAQPALSLPTNYSSSARRLNPSFAAMSARQSPPTYNPQPRADLLARNDVVQTTPPLTNAQRMQRRYDLQPTRAIPERQDLKQDGPATADVRMGRKILQPPSDELSSRNQHGDKHRPSFSDASRRHRHEWHDRSWWKKNCTTIVFVNSAYYFLDAGYWYPAWGYDPLNSYYDYDGPIYTYGNLLPDQMIANVQAALQDAGYYFGAVTGSLNVETRAALANFQRDYGLPITGAIDQPTVETLGLY